MSLSMIDSANDMNPSAYDFAPVLVPNGITKDDDGISRDRLGDEESARGNGSDDFIADSGATLPVEDNSLDDQEHDVETPPKEHEIMKTLSENYNASLPTHTEALRVFFGSFTIIIVFTLGVVLFWAATRAGSDACRVTANDVQEYLNTKAAAAGTIPSTLKHMAIASVVIPDILTSSIWDFLIPGETAIIFGIWTVVYFGPPYLWRILLGAVLLHPIIGVPRRIRSFESEDEDNRKSSVSLIVLAYACLCITMATLYWCWFGFFKPGLPKEVAKERSADYHRKLGKSVMEYILNLVAGTCAHSFVLYFGVLIATLLKKIQLRFGNDSAWSSQLIVLILESGCMFLFFSVIFPIMARVRSIVFMRNGQNILEFPMRMGMQQNHHHFRK